MGAGTGNRDVAVQLRVPGGKRFPECCSIKAVRKTEMTCELGDSLEFLFSDSVTGRRLRTFARVDVPRGGTAAVHVLINDAPRERLAVSVTEGGRRVRRARWSRLVDVPVEANTGPVIYAETRKSGRNRHVIRRAPFRVCDAMEPLGDAVKPGARTVALRLQIPVAGDARPGRRRYSVTVGRDSGLTLDTVVHRAVVSPAGKESFPYTNWFDVPAMAYRHGLKEWSAGHWAMIRRYADLMRHARQNVFWIPLRLVFRRKGGVPVLDRPRLRRFVETFTRAGMHMIEGGHFAVRSGNWREKGFSVALDGPPAATPAGDSGIRAIARQLLEEIDRNGWRKRWIQHVADEPQPVVAANYRILTGMVRKYMPGIPIIDATEDPSLVGSVDIWCPKCNAYQKDRKRYDALRAAGDRMWFYTCCEPGGEWLNRLLDMELLRPALLGWGAARFGLDGFLHWGLNHWRRNQDPFRQSVIGPRGGPERLPAGDTHIVYPGRDGPWSSVRLEAQREGFEDLELLRALAVRRPSAARAIVRRALRSFDDYTKDPAVFRSARRALLGAAGR